jgi:NAD-dependent DNA ligase
LELLQKNGHIFSSTVTKKTDFLVVGKKSGTKVKAAKKSNVKIISELDFIKKFTN